MAKNSSRPVTDLGNNGPLKVLNGIKLILQVLQESPTFQTTNLSGTNFCRFLQTTGSSASNRTTSSISYKNRKRVPMEKICSKWQNNLQLS